FEELNRPPVTADVRRAPAEDPAFDLPHRARGIVGLRDEATTKTVWDVHASEENTSSTLEVKVTAVRDVRRSSGTPALLSIGELAERTGVATTALRYYDQLGLVRPAARESGGRRRYAASAVAEVSVIRFFREVGFTLAEIDSLLGAGEQRSRHAI